MIVLISYWFWLLWNLPTDKAFFAIGSTVEFMFELWVLVLWLLIWQPWKKEC